MKVLKRLRHAHKGLLYTTPLDAVRPSGPGSASASPLANGVKTAGNASNNSSIVEPTFELRRWLSARHAPGGAQTPSGSKERTWKEEILSFAMPTAGSSTKL
jgi:hypothetical protein